jgi:hypothetical protein
MSNHLFKIGIKPCEKHDGNWNILIIKDEETRVDLSIHPESLISALADYVDKLKYHKEIREN